MTEHDYDYAARIQQRERRRNLAGLALLLGWFIVGRAAGMIADLAREAEDDYAAAAATLGAARDELHDAHNRERIRRR